MGLHDSDSLRPIVASVLLSVCLVGAQYTRILFGAGKLSKDSALFLYSGQLLAQGTPTYLHVWDIKPPGIHLTTAILALIAGGNRELTYFLAIGVAALFAAILVGFVVLVSYELTNNASAAAVGGLAVFAYPPFLSILTIGIYTKYFAAAFGLAGIYFYLRDRPLISCALTALAAAFWQFTVIFLIAVILGIIQDIFTDKRSPRTALYGFGIVFGIASLVVAPFVYLGAFRPLISQTVIAPVLTGSLPITREIVLDRLGMVKYLLAGATGVLLWSQSIQRRRPTWGGIQSNLVIFLVVPVAWFMIGGYVTGQMGQPDLIPLVAFVGIIVAYALNYLVRQNLTTPYALVLFGLVILISLNGAINGLFFDWPLGNSRLMHLYWSGDITSECHLRLSRPEEQWMELVGETEATEQCDGNIW